jgi:nucleoside-diphosphate-sugar epimerase
MNQDSKIAAGAVANLAPRTRIVIIGAGLGGCISAYALGPHHDVTVIEMGRSTYDLERRIVDDGWPACGSPHVGSGLGGGTALWHNALIEIEDEIFKAHWPFLKSELAPWYDAAYPLLCGVRRSAFADAAETMLQEHKKLGLAADLFQWQYVAASRRNLWNSLGLAGRVRLVNGEALEFTTEGAKIKSVTVRTGKDEQQIDGDYFLFAGGGFGTPILLQKLAGKVAAPGLKNAGRYYEDHAIGFIGQVKIARPFYRLWNYPAPGGCLRQFSVVRCDGLHFGFQLRPAALRLREDRAARIGSVITKLRNQMWNPINWLRLLVHWDDILDIFSMKFGIRVPTSHYSVFIQAGQPLSDQLGVYGATDQDGDSSTIHRNWMLTPEFFATVRSAMDRFIEQIHPIARSFVLLPDWPKALATGAHHSGAARMSSDPAQGVCDASGQIHGLENAYIADGSVIPCSGMANTGLTIAALALRLSDRLHKRIETPTQVAEKVSEASHPDPKSRGICLITGATGFIGSRLCARLQWSGERQIRAMVRSVERGAAIAGPHLEIVQGDLLDRDAIARALEGCDAVIHLAHAEDDVAARATRNLVEAASRAGIRRFVHVSSISVHGPVPGPDATHESTARIGRYGESYCDAKAEEEEIVRQAMDAGHLSAVILRPTVVYGPGGFFVNAVIKEARAGSATIIDDGSGLCNAVYVDDVCDAIEAALRSQSAPGHAMFVNADRAITWREFTLAMAALVNPAPELKSVSAADALAWWAAHPIQPPKPPRSLPHRIFRKLVRTIFPKPGPPFPHPGRISRESVRVEFSNAEAKRLLGWTPQVDFAAGVARVRESIESEN